MNTIEMKAELERLDSLRWDLRSLVESVNHTTRDIKYAETHSTIISAVETLAEENSVDVSYEVDAVREAFNALESAIYNLVEPFQDEARYAENDFDDLDSEISEIEYEAKEAKWA
jgi:hypothetical protein|tara:strand:- start:10592 stop:10936 length:345 start_codon:yes stop_codon:yes gene_type:complete